MPFIKPSPYQRDMATLGPFVGGLNNAAGVGDYIDDKELFDIVNLELDYDGSLANRPAINTLTLDPGLVTTGIRVIGTYMPDDGRNWIVCTIGSILRIIDPINGTSVASQAVTAGAVVQYNNRLFVIPAPGTTGGGYFNVVTPGSTPVWTADANIAAGRSAVVYLNRVFIAAGIDSTSNTSRMYYSNAGATSFTGVGTGNVDIEPGNGQKLVYLIALNNDIVIFKEHSTFRYGYTSDPSQATISKTSSTIGAPAANCAVSYNNNNIYVLHDNSIYELYNFMYTKLSTALRMDQKLDPTIYSDETFGLTLFRDRLFVRYYSSMYVYSLITKTWSRWETAKKFSRLVVVPSSSVGLDIAYCNAASSDNAGRLFSFRDDRMLGIGTAESFTCSITTKTYDFNIPYTYKMLFYWDAVIATSGVTTCTITIPNSSINLTWDQFAAYTWDQMLAIPIPWDSSTVSTVQTVTNAAGGLFGRKTIKNMKKLRFKQAYFTISTQALANRESNAAVRLYEITAFVRQRQELVKGTT